MRSETQRFDRAAAGWDAKKRRRDLALAVAKALLELPLDKTMKAMEYGCGTGLVGLQIAPRIGSLTAVDTSTGMLDVLSDKISSLGLDNVKPLCLDLTREPLLERFDLIFCSMTLHHICDPETLIQRFSDLLAPAGFLAIADLDLEDGTFHGPKVSGVHHFGFDRQWLRGCFECSGLRETTLRTVHRFTKTDGGKERDYTVFFASGRKDSPSQ